MGQLFSHSPASLPALPQAWTCYKGRDPGREGFFSEGNEIVIKIGVFGNDHG